MRVQLIVPYFRKHTLDVHVSMLLHRLMAREDPQLLLWGKEGVTICPDHQIWMVSLTGVCRVGGEWSVLGLWAFVSGAAPHLPKFVLEIHLRNWGFVLYALFLLVKVQKTIIAQRLPCLFLNTPVLAQSFVRAPLPHIIIYFVFCVVRQNYAVI